MQETNHMTIRYILTIIYTNLGGMKYKVYEMK